MRAAVHVWWGFLLLIGIALGAGYIVQIMRTNDADARWDAAPLAGFSATALCAAGLTAVAALRSRARAQRRKLTLPPVWVSAVALFSGIAGGEVASRSSRWPALDPLLAVLVVAAMVSFILRSVMRWAPASSGPEAAEPVAWGMTAGPVIALVLQMAGLVAVCLAVAGGLLLAGGDVLDGVRERGVEQIVRDADNDLASTATVAVGLTGMYAIVAPLTEEFSKLLGVIALLRRRPVTRYQAFVTGVCAGAGFAAVETLAYALAAGDQWPLVAGVRAPVALIHVAATGVAALGWYAQANGVRWGIVAGYGTAILVHGAWNALTVAALVISASVDDPESLEPGTALIVFGVLCLMALLLSSCFVWLSLVARRLGRDATHQQMVDSAPISREPQTDRSNVLATATLGEIWQVQDSGVVS